MATIWEPDPAFVLHDPPRLERFVDVFATRFTYADGAIAGALYASDGEIIPLSQRFSGFGGDRVVNADDASITIDPAAERIGGRGYYLGHLFAHYGHFITEGLSTLWALQAGEEAFDYYAVHPFIFGSQVPDFVRLLMERMGLDADKIHVIRQPTIFSDMTVPERGWRLNQSAFAVMQDVVERIVPPGDRSSATLKVYLSRKNLAARAVRNEAEIEDVFRRNGFLVVHPEAMPLDEQLDIYRRSAVLAGFGGSALHNVLFSPRGAGMIAVGDERSPVKPIPNQRICNALAETTAVVLPHAGSDGSFDIGHLEREMDAAEAIFSRAPAQ